MVKNIVFDFGGVLLDWNPRYLYRDYFKDGQEMEYFLANICTLERNSELDRGVPFQEWVAKYQAMFPQYSEAIALYHTGWPKMLKDSIPEGTALLEDLKSKGYSIYGLTNWSAETIGFAYGRFGFFKDFDGIVVSGEEKVTKPDPEIFRILLDRYGLDAGECVFLDDSPVNVSAAASLGFNAVLFDDIGRVRAELEMILNRK